MNEKTLRTAHLRLLLAALLCTPVLLTACGDDDDTPAPVTPPADDKTKPTAKELLRLWNPDAPEATALTADALRGTWQVTASKGYTLEDDGASSWWDRDAKGDNEYFIIYPEGNLQSMTFDNRKQAWRVDGTATYTLQGGRADFQSSYFLGLRILACEGDAMTLRYYTQSQYVSGTQDRYTKTLQRISTRTDFIGVK